MNWMGYTPIRALSVGGAYGDLRDDWDTLTDKEQRWLDIIPWLIVTAAAGLLISTFLLGGTAVHVNSRTEHLVYTPLFSDPPLWLLKDAVFEESDLYSVNDDALFGAANSPIGSYRNMLQTKVDGNFTYLINGFLQLNCGDRVTISRIGTGAIKVDVSAVRDVIVTDEVENAVQFFGPVKTDGTKRPVLQLSRSFSFYPHSMIDLKDTTPTLALAESMASTSYVWPMEGQILPSRAVGVDTVATHGLMLSGNVNLFNRRVWDKNNYAVATHELELGDHLVLATTEATEKKRDTIIREWASETDKLRTEDASTRTPWKPENCEDLQPMTDSFGLRPSQSSGTDKGFVHIDMEEAGMALSLVSNAKHVDIKRYRSSPIRLQSSLIKRLQNDRLFGLGWSVIIAAFIAYRKFARAYVMSRGRHNRLLASDADAPTSTERDTPPSSGTLSPSGSDESTQPSDGIDSSSDQSQ